MADADDTVQLTMLSGAKQATVSTGDGINTVNATVSGGDLTLSGAGSNRFSVTT